MQALVSKLNRLSLWHRTLELWGYRLTTPSLDRLVSLALHRARLVGTEEIGLLQREVRAGMRVLDIGANQGIYTVLLSKLVGDSGCVFSFEPDEELFATLCHNVKVNALKNVKLFNTALGSESGTKKLFRSLFNSGDNRLTRHERSLFYEEAVVKLSKLDDLLPNEHVDFAKIDVQGWEMQVGYGMEQTLSNNFSIRILFEFWPSGLRLAGTDPVDLLRWLKSHGFSIHTFGKGKQVRIDDFGGLAHSIPLNRFLNLYAVRE